jgi:hypothetical protein
MKTMKWFALLAIVGVLGCGDSGPPLSPVKGKVTLYGKPYTKGIVTFTPEGGGPAGASPTDENGDYELWSGGKKGAVIGKHKVSVTTIMESKKTAPPPGATSSNDPGYSAFGDTSEYKAVEKEKKEPIPAKYNTATELVKEVNSGSNTIDLELK